MTPADPEAISWIRVAVAFMTVAGLIGLMGVALRYIGQRGLRLPGMMKGAGRLAILETIPVDVRRRLVIVRCDDQEHLLLLGGNQDIVVESNLKAPSAPAQFRTKPSA